MMIPRHWTGRFLMLIGASLLPLAPVGCAAQHADMKRMEHRFEKKIADLDRRDQALEQKLEMAHERIDQLTEYAKRLFRVARARSRLDLRNLQGEELADIEGRLENADSFLIKSRKDMAALQQRLDELTQALIAQEEERAQQLEALGQSHLDQLASLESNQERLRQELDAAQQSLRDELGKLYAYVEALDPTLKALAKKIAIQIEEHQRAIQANSATAHSLGAHLVEMQAALVNAMPNLALPSPPEPLSGVAASPPTPSDQPDGPREASPSSSEPAATPSPEEGKDVQAPSAQGEQADDAPEAGRD